MTHKLWPMSAENESERRGNRFQESERIRRREIEIGWFQNLFRIIYFEEFISSKVITKYDHDWPSNSDLVNWPFKDDNQ